MVPLFHRARNILGDKFYRFPALKQVHAPFIEHLEASARSR
jgi:hypothetical protein